MKKLLLTLGTIASIAAPVAAVVACSDSKTVTLNFTQTMTKKQFESEFAKYTSMGDYVIQLEKSSESKEVKIKKIKEY